MKSEGRITLSVAVGIVGASGYSGLELARILASHAGARIQKLYGNASSGKRIEGIHPSLRHVISMEIVEFSGDSLKGIDVLFVALPSGQAMSIVPTALANGCRVIDLGGDFRLSNNDTYRKFYGHEHTAQEFLGSAIYGLAEWNCEAIKSAKLVANPGCYPTSIQLPLIPLLKDGLLDESTLGITSYSGTSGAGKSVTEKMMFTETHDSVRAYRALNHQHIPEIQQYLRAFSGANPTFSFVPHLLPVARGIYTTIHAQMKKGVTESTIGSALASSYTSSPFVRVSSSQIPEMKDVLYTNFCDIGFAISGRSLVLFSTIDNLGKGAAGQAVQNMNIMFGLSQTEGLIPCFQNK